MSNVAFLKTKFVDLKVNFFVGCVKNKGSLKQLMTLVHGDAKLDNFLFKKEGWGDDDKVQDNKDDNNRVATQLHCEA